MGNVSKIFTLFSAVLYNNHYTLLTVWLFCTEKYKPEVDNAARAWEGCTLTEGLYFEVRTAKQLVLDLLTCRIYFKLHFYYHSIRFLLNLMT